MPFSATLTIILPFYVLFSYVFLVVHGICTFYHTDHIYNVNPLCVQLGVLASTSYRWLSNHTLYIAKCPCHAFVHVLTDLISS